MLTGNDWDEVLKEEIDSDYFKQLQQFLAMEYAQHTIYPSMVNIYNALRLTPYENVKVVILGQDPYHGPGQAHGLSFSVQMGVPIPPSLQNIYKEMAQDIGFVNPGHGCLTEWAEQGVLLLNTVLTVRAGQAGSHRGMGWEQFTDAIIRKLNERQTPIVFMLWGANAKQKKPLIDNPAHLVLTAAHPSPLSAYNGFFGCRHFSQATRFLNQNGMNIDWQLSRCPG
ncbi:MAG TPA: uracil-DNA glycosylase [Candidatus Faecivivens stercoripullorum]|uniref:Uracil-DNA glycosylase n=1 Tax=Candidatus Faecivivens stercoripullorum TaxID=2840805 RepID=A0A9D1KS71_9FIRM|nr:uracil-DNA glycosylase [Candidatus Faecivivens stercoripullorum]